MTHTGLAGAKSTTETDSGMCVHKCIRLFFEYVLAKESTGDLRIPNNNQSKHRTRSNGSCTVGYSSIDTTIREELSVGTNDEGWTRQGTWLDLLENWGFKTEHIPERSELGGTKPAILGQFVPTLVIVKLAKMEENGRKLSNSEFDYNMTHMILLLPSNGNGTKSKLIDPDGGKHNEFDTSPFANWAKMTKKERKNTKQI